MHYQENIHNKDSCHYTYPNSSCSFNACHKNQQSKSQCYNEVDMNIEQNSLLQLFPTNLGRSIWEITQTTKQ